MLLNINFLNNMDSKELYSLIMKHLTEKLKERSIYQQINISDILIFE